MIEGEPIYRSHRFDQRVPSTALGLRSVRVVRGMRTDYRGADTERVGGKIAKLAGNQTER